MSKTTLKRLLMYYRIHELKKSRFKVSQISRELGISRKTVYFYLSMDEPSFKAWLLTGRSRKLSDYEALIRDRLRRYDDLSGYQIHDWLLEHYPEVEVSRRTVSDFVAHVRRKYHIPKPSKEGRVYEQVAETGYGKQAQVDFGQSKLETPGGKTIKIYFFVMVLSRSRAKFVCFSREPFTAFTTVEAHEAAFSYFGGIPETLVYDQDSVLMVDENHGDLVLTQTFQSYVQDRSFGLRFCRKSDPESKGKIESVVKYVKSNFLPHRQFDTLELLNEEALAWLGRTANGQMHGTTKKIPAEELEVEKAHLRPFTPGGQFAPPAKAYAVRKDNTFSYRGNYYSLPSGTYRGKGTQVWISLEGESLIICQQDQAEIARHQLCHEKGKQIRNNDHFRDKSPKLAQLRTSLCARFTDQQATEAFFDQIYQDKGRYFRDQLLLIRKCLNEHQGNFADQALSFCLNKKLFSASDFQDLMAHLNREARQEPEGPTLEQVCLQTSPTEHLQIIPQKTDIQSYEQLFNSSQS